MSIGKEHTIIQSVFQKNSNLVLLNCTCSDGSLLKDFPLSVCFCAGFFCLLPRLVYILNTLLIVVLTVIQCIFMQHTTAICISVMLTTLGQVTMTKD